MLSACSLFTVHCSLFTVHCSLFTVHCSLFTAHCSLSQSATSIIKNYVITNHGFGRETIQYGSKEGLKFMIYIYSRIEIW